MYSPPPSNIHTKQAILNDKIFTFVIFIVVSNVQNIYRMNHQFKYIQFLQREYTKFEFFWIFSEDVLKVTELGETRNQETGDDLQLAMGNEALTA